MMAPNNSDNDGQQFKKKLTQSVYCLLLKLSQSMNSSTNWLQLKFYFTVTDKCTLTVSDKQQKKLSD